MILAAVVTPAQRVIVAAWFRLKEVESSWVPGTADDDPYGPVDYAVARELDIPVERVGEALVAAGKRPPVWWIG